MLRSIKHLYGDKLRGTDGDVGGIEDFYFDDLTWGVRYVVADTGSWLMGRQVLISPHAFAQLDPIGKIQRVNLARKQIEDSPSIASHMPVSRQFEEEYHRYYGWPYYWQGDALWGMSGIPLMEPPSPPSPGKPAVGWPQSGPDAHLRSARAVSGYHIQASDGTMGCVCDFLMDQQSWAIRELVVKIGHRFSGKEVQIPASQISRISYEESRVYVNLTMNAVENSPGPQLVPAEAGA